MEVTMWYEGMQYINQDNLMDDAIVQIEIGNVIETTDYYLVTREDENIIFARRVAPYIKLEDEFILFTKKNIEKELASIGVRGIIDMNEVIRRYLDLT